MAKRMSKETRKKRTIRVILIVVIVLAVIAAGVGVLRRTVTSRVNEGEDEALTATVTRGSISTTVSGSGNLTDEDVKEIKLHSDVEIDEIVVEAGDTVAEGDLMATVNMSTVLSAMADVQADLNELDDEIGEASGDELEDTIISTVAGRVKKVYAKKGDDVSSVMYKDSALALLSLDGYMAVKIETTELEVGEKVTVKASNGTSYSGTVETVGDKKSVILLSDEKAAYGDTVTVTDSEQKEVGSGTLYIHEEMKITGIAGTVAGVNISENARIQANATLFTLSDTSFSANYTSLLKERSELEEQLTQLIKIYQEGAVLAPNAGVISSVGSESTTSSYGMGMTATTEEALLSISSNEKMSVTVQVDETDILSLEEGQTATVTIDALPDASVEGSVSAIDTTASSSGGVTAYTVTVSFDKTEDMLSGMSASVAIAIEGVEDALLIPSDALTQTSAKSYVYTSYDEETGELGGMVEVTAGMDNGEYVEITEGLSEGDTVYYFENEDTGFGFGNMDFGGGMPGGFGGSGGGMPSGFGGSGGGMPSGGMPGGGSMPGGRGN